MRILIVLTLAFLCALGTHGAIVGIDLGGEFIKMTGPKNNNIDIILNEQAHRKIFHYIGFRADERYFGEDAKNFAARFPDNMFTLMHRLAGTPFNETVIRNWYANEMIFKAALEETLSVNPNGTSATNLNASSGTISFKTGSNPTISYATETLLGMLFGYLRDTAEKDTGLKIRDAVVTVPVFATPRQRQALIDAAALGGLNVVALMHSTTAAALQYGLQNRGFGNETITVAIYDMGSTRTEVGIYQFSPAPPPKKGAKPKLSEAYGVMTTRAIVSDPFLGGRGFDVCLSKMLEDRAVAEMKPAISRVLGGETLAQRKSIISLLRAANKLKETLSANRMTPIAVEGIAPDREFNTKVSREEFEAACAPLFERAAALLPAAMKKAGVEANQLHAVELMGGGGRIPKLLDALAAVRGKPIDRTLNADEAAAFGAGFYASVVSGRFRVKCFQVVESLHPAAPDNYIGFTLSPAAANSAAAPTVRPLFGAASLIGQRKSISLNRTTDFDVNIFRVEDGQNKLDYTIHVEGVDSALRQVAFYAASAPTADGAAPATPALAHPNNTHSVFIELKATESGLVSLVEAEVRISYAVNTSKRVKVNLSDAELEAERETVKKEHVVAMANRDKVKAEKLAAEAAAKAAEAEKPAAAAPADGADAAATAETKEGEKPEAAEATAEGAADNATATKNATVEDKDTPEAREALLAKRLAAVKTYKMTYQTVEEMQKHYAPLTGVSVTHAFPRPLSVEDSDFIKGLLKVWAESDRVKRETASAKNDLDTFLVWAKNEGILENKEMKDLKMINDEELEKIREALSKASDWMDDEGSYDSTTKDKYEEQLALVKGVAKDVLARWDAHRNPPVKKEKAAAADKDADDEEDAAKGTKKASKDKKKKKAKPSKKTAASEDKASSEETGDAPSDEKKSEEQTPKTEKTTGDGKNEDLDEDDVPKAEL